MKIFELRSFELWRFNCKCLDSSLIVFLRFVAAIILKKENKEVQRKNTEEEISEDERNLIVNLVHNNSNKNQQFAIIKTRFAVNRGK